MAFVSNSEDLLASVKSKLRCTFDVKLYGSLKSFIKWDIRRKPGGLKVDQKAYAVQILQRFGLEQCNATNTPLPTKPDLTPRHEDEPTLLKERHNQYRSIIGAINYLAVCTRPDLTFAVSSLSRFLHDPCDRHYSLAKRLLRYISGTTEYGLHFAAGNNGTIHADCDSDWAGDIETRRSTSGYIVRISGTPIFWCSKRQTVVTLSSGEAEYSALSSCSRDVSWIRNLWYEISNSIPYESGSTISATPISVDSSTGNAIASQRISSSRTKHIDIKEHHVRELVERKVVFIESVKTSNQVADSLTKP